MTRAFAINWVEHRRAEAGLPMVVDFKPEADK
jgi:hypothetical protein